MTGTDQNGHHFCWDEIGIAGDRSCKLLIEHVHCRNCPQYSVVGRALFDREMPEDYRHEVSQEIAARPTAPAEETESVLVLRMGSEWFALRTQVFDEISRYQKPYTLPFRSGTLLAGLVNVNGELLLCISLEAALGLQPEETKPSERSRICVVGNGSERFAFRVDEILGVRQVPRVALRPVPVTLAKSPSAQASSCFQADGLNVGFIDEQKLFSSLNRSLQW